jgi:hypothetical protein
MVYLVEFHEITKILLTLREITKKITKNFQLPKKSEKLRNITKSNLNYQIWSHWLRIARGQYGKIRQNKCLPYNKYMLFTGWEVRIEKYFVEVSKR